jgi:drug/metabolite transporter (DMT)-like permease
MITWLLVIILAYFFLALAAFGDKLFLTQKESPINYTFYVGALSGLVILLIPFIGFEFHNILIGLIEGVVYIGALYSMYYVLSKSEVSIAVPVMGGLQPIFVFILTLVFYSSLTFASKDIIAFAILILGTVLISFNSNFRFDKKVFCLALIPALLFAIDYILTKQVFETNDFWHGLVLMRTFSFLTVLLFLFRKKFREQIFKKKKGSTKKGFIFILAQGSGGLGILLQSFAISIVPITYLATLNALKGVQYVFLFFITIIISLFLPKILKENINKRVLIRKGISIVLIALGIILLVL